MVGLSCWHLQRAGTGSSSFIESEEKSSGRRFSQVSGSGGIGAQLKLNLFKVANSNPINSYCTALLRWAGRSEGGGLLGEHILFTALLPLLLAFSSSHTRTKVTIKIRNFIENQEEKVKNRLKYSNHNDHPSHESFLLWTYSRTVTAWPALGDVI